MISTATAAVKAVGGVAGHGEPDAERGEREARSPPARTPPRPGRPAAAPGALPDWASVHQPGRSGPARCRRPTRVARTTSRPPALTVAPVTASPGPTSTGTLSPVSSDASTAEVPSSTTPSVATFSPGRTTKRSPTASSPIGTRTSSAVAAARPRPWRRARAGPAAPRPARRLARASKYRPARMNTVTADGDLEVEVSWRPRSSVQLMRHPGCRRRRRTARRATSRTRPARRAR